MRDITISLLLLAIFVAWLIAEFRGNRPARIGLSITCMLLLVAGIYIVMDSAEIQLAMHRRALQQIRRTLDAGDEQLIRKALSTYGDVYEQTGSTKSAVMSMLPVLSKHQD